MAARSRWVSYNSFVFESDCLVVVAWVANSSSAPWRFHNVFREYFHVFGFDISWSISHISQSGNNAADALGWSQRI